MFQVASLTLFAFLLARVLRAPRGTWRFILGAAALVLAASQLLPEGNAFREDVAGSAGTLFWIGLGLVPVAAYGVVVWHVRRRTGVDAPAAPSHPRGLVQFPEDAALARETAAALAAAAPPTQHVSFGWRAEDGALVGHLRLRRTGDLAEIEMLHVDPAHRRQGIATALLAAATGEAARAGASRCGALVGDWQVPAVFAASGFAPGPALPAGDGHSRLWLEKPL